MGGRTVSPTGDHGGFCRQTQESPLQPAPTTLKEPSPNRGKASSDSFEGINSFAFLTLAHAVARFHDAPTTTSWAQIEGMVQAYPTSRP